MFEVVVDPRVVCGCACPHAVDLDREVCGVYEYTQDSVDGMFCPEFWVPVRPTQNCAGVGVVFCMPCYLMIL